MTGRPKLAFVVQRYGLEIAGGAEYHCRLIAELLRDHLVDRGARADVGSGCLLRLVGAKERGGHPVIGARHARRRFG